WSAAEAAGKGTDTLSYKEICKQVNELFHAAVERRLVSDVPFGAFLSGGIDSSAVVAAMSRVARSRVETFSVTFDESEFSEAKYARMIAEKFGTSHHEIKLNLPDFLEELPAALMAMDHPSGDGPNTYVVSKATKRAGVTMALSGLGGDELFAGYDVFKRMAELQKKSWLNAVPAFGRRAAGSFLRKIRPGIPSEKKSALLALDKISFDTAYPLTRQVMLDDRVKNILKETPASNKVKAIISGLKKPDAQSLLSKVSLAEMDTYMQNVLLRDTDQMSMAHALEVRVPFLDYKLVEFVLSVPDKFKYPHTPKKLLIDAMDGALPVEIIDRPKMGFTLPFKEWMKRELKGFCEEKIKALSGRSCFNQNEVMQLWENFLKSDPAVAWSSIWYLVVLEHWLQLNGINE
ncbi:MAG TPA: asparagine synthase C-terminal domain-containing protein, partial [Bacteroidia bacterium]